MDAPCPGPPRPAATLPLLLAARAPASIALLAVLLVACLPQAHDMLLGLASAPLGALAFQLALLILAASAWFWSRAAVGAWLGGPDTAALRDGLPVLLPHPLERAVWLLLPRLLWALCGGGGIVLALRSGAWLQAGICLAWIAGGLVLLARRPRPRRPRYPGPPGADGRICLSDAAPWGLRRTSTLIVAACLALILEGALAGLAPGVLPDPWRLLGRLFPGPAAGLVGLACLMAPLTRLTMLCDTHPPRLAGRRLPAPALALLALWVALVPGLLALHRLRTSAGGLEVARRVGLAVALRSWQGSCAGPATRLRPVVVALSGGATRAGLWGARVLHDIDRDVAASGVPGSGIFAISSSSGGSLGAAAYLLSRGGACILPPGPLAAGWQARFSRDMTGPLLASAILGDPARALLAPLAWPVLAALRRWPPAGGDRAAELELSFERIWPGLAAPFLSLFYTRAGAWRRGTPVWIANGTDEAAGTRLLTLPVARVAADRQGAAGLDPGWPFLASGDALALLDRDVALSTAIDNSARFAYLGPAGEIAPGTDIVDGGYFEDTGITTALELVRWLRAVGPAITGRPVDPVLVAATADAPLAITATVRCGEPEAGRSLVRWAGGNELLAPLLSLYDVRGGHGATATAAAMAALCADDDFFHFTLHVPPGRQIPLNWNLSPQAAGLVWRSMDDPDNARELGRLSRALRRP